MAPRFLTNPAPKTESAREARKSFFCELCQKGYSRMPELEAHQSSYDHQHKQRLKDMKQMSKDPNAAANARRLEQRENQRAGLISIKLGSEAAGAGKKEGSGGFKKGGFKTVFQMGSNKDGEKKDGEKSEEAEKKVAISGFSLPKTEVEPPKVTEPVKPVEAQPEIDYTMDLAEGEEDWLGDEEFWNEGDPGYEYYDPAKPSHCGSDCTCHNP